MVAPPYSLHYIFSFSLISVASLTNKLMLKAKHQAASDKAQSNMPKDRQPSCIRMIGQTNWWVYGIDESAY
jgi:hypothetical protein